jgi:sugar O-acyltransferase (sialic acid O-acetyltransferase NeuD family)
VQKLLIHGSGGHAIAAHELAILLKMEIAGFIDVKPNPNLLEQKKIFQFEEILTSFQDFSHVVAIGDIQKRRRAVQSILQVNPDVDFVSLVHPTAFVSSSASIGKGSLVFAYANIGPYAELGSFVISNTHSSIDHHSSVGDYSNISPGVIVGGKTSIGSEVFIGMGAKISNNLVLGNGCVIGANSFVSRSFKSGFIVGTPAEIKHE